jgi:hypothetical protein
MAGNVYVFNTTNAQLQLILNNTIVSTTLAGVTQSGGYAPTAVTIARNPSTGNPGTNQFGATNNLIVSYGSGGGTSQKFAVNIDPNQNPIANDLQLYIYFNIAVLVSGGGQGSSIPGGGGTTLVVGIAVPDAEVKAISAASDASGGSGSSGGSGGSGGGHRPNNRDAG